MTKTDRDLERVQTLYLMQVQLIHALESDLTDPESRKHVRKQLKDFEALLEHVDHRYMGGEDVLEALRSLPKEMVQKLREAPHPRLKRKSKKK